jgi:hypothetical protein
MRHQPRALPGEGRRVAVPLRASRLVRSVTGNQWDPDDDFLYAPAKRVRCSIRR